uniref:Huntingtin interacting protein 1 related n=2 Tax=Nothobranchius korthausae TaxID=1143690 RepID=A0A1A8EN25_9TELE
MDGTGRQWVKGSSIQADSVCRSSQSTELPVKDLSSSTVQRQRRELQLLMVELKDREVELNTMAASQDQQHQAWEQDRQRALVLEQRCARLDEELRKRNEVMRAVTKHVCVVESREREVQMKLSKAKQKLCELEEKQEHIIGKCRDYEGSDHLSRCSLQHLLGGSRLLKRLSLPNRTDPVSSCRIADPLYVHECLRAHHLCPNTSLLKAGADPPTSCLHPSATQPASQADDAL